MRGNRFTIYDALEKSGYFDSNPANTFARNPVDGSPLFTGPQQYPKMLYHPKGEERVTVAAEVIMTPVGPKLVGEQKELIWQIVSNQAEDVKALAEGWHDHPAKAIRARIEAQIEANPELGEEEKAKLLKAVPAMGSDARVKELEAELARLTKDRAAEVKAAGGPVRAALGQKTQAGASAGPMT